MSGTWATGWVAGDVVTAAEYAKGVGAISAVTLGSAQATIDVSSIVAGYGDLEIEFLARGDTAATTANLFLRFNNDSGANYDYQVLVASAGTVSSAETFGQTSGAVGVIPAASAGASLAGGGIIHIPGYAGTTFNKVALCTTTYKIGTSSGNMTKRDNAIFWRNSAAITRVTLLLSAGNFATGSYVVVRVKGI